MKYCLIYTVYWNIYRLTFRGFICAEFVICRDCGVTTLYLPKFAVSYCIRYNFCFKNMQRKHYSAHSVVWFCMSSFVHVHSSHTLEYQPLCTQQDLHCSLRTMLSCARHPHPCVAQLVQFLPTLTDHLSPTWLPTLTDHLSPTWLPTLTDHLSPTWLPTLTDHLSPTSSQRWLITWVPPSSQRWPITWVPPGSQRWPITWVPPGSMVPAEPSWFVATWAHSWSLYHSWNSAVVFFFSLSPQWQWLSPEWQWLSPEWQWLSPEWQRLDITCVSVLQLRLLSVDCQHCSVAPYLVWNALLCQRFRDTVISRPSVRSVFSDAFDLLAITTVSAAFAITFFGSYQLLLRGEEGTVIDPRNVSSCVKCLPIENMASGNLLTAQSFRTVWKYWTAQFTDTGSEIQSKKQLKSFVPKQKTTSFLFWPGGGWLCGHKGGWTKCTRSSEFSPGFRFTPASCEVEAVRLPVELSGFLPSSFPSFESLSGAHAAANSCCSRCSSLSLRSVWELYVYWFPPNCLFLFLSIDSSFFPHGLARNWRNAHDSIQTLKTARCGIGHEVYVSWRNGLFRVLWLVHGSFF